MNLEPASKKSAFVDNQKIPSGKSWKRVLDEIYQFAPHQYGDSSKCLFSSDEHSLAKKLHISGYELMLALSFLEDHKLISRFNMVGIDGHSSSIQLTKDGFDVALANETSSKNLSFQRVMATGAALAGFISIIFLLLDLSEKYPPDTGFNIFTFVILLIFVTIFIAFSTGDLVNHYFISRRH